MDLKFKDNSKLKLALFTQLEYIESTGTQYIDTGFKPNQDTRVILEFNDLNQSVTFLFGSRISSSNAEFGYINGTTVGQGARYGNQERTLAITHNVKLTLDVNKTNWTLSNGNTANFNTTTFQSTVNCLLFAFNNGGTANYVSIRVYSCKIYDNNTLIRNFIPAEDANGVICLYDTVSQSFFYNQGTGNFIAGPIIKPQLSGSILLKITTLYHQNTPNINGLQFLRSVKNVQETAEDVVLNRIRVDIGNVSGSLSDLLQYVSMSGFNDAGEEQEKPRLVGTWTINDWYTTTQLAQAQATFDGLTIVGDPNYALDFSQMAVQVLDPNEDNYNPAVAIILQGHNLGTTMTKAPLGHGRWFITKTQAVSVTSMANGNTPWFYTKSTVIDTNAIVTSDASISYDFSSFDEFQYFGITRVGDSYFQNCNMLTSIIIPNNCSTIGQLAFNNTALINITLPNSITSIGSKAFDNCRNLENVVLPNSITSLEDYTFRNCVELKNIILPDSIITIKSSVFYLCGQLLINSLPSSISSIGSSAFFGCASIGNISIPSSITVIGADAFNGCSISTSVNLPNLTSIGDRAFYNTKITSIVSLGETITSIPNKLFQVCSYLTSVVLPSTTTSIGGDNFYQTPITSMTVKATTPPTVNLTYLSVNCAIYVPSESVADYQSASGWSSHAAHIQAIPSN